MTAVILNINDPQKFVFSVFATLFLIIIASVIFFYKRAVHGKALVRTGFGGPRVTFDRGLFVIPFVQTLEVVDTTIKTICKANTFEDLYNEPERFKMEVIQVIGRDLNGYFLDDLAIEYFRKADK